jgi:hypothetical protein
MADQAFVPLPRHADPYLRGEGGNCGFVRVSGKPCRECFREDEEWHQQGCPNDRWPERA